MSLLEIKDLSLAIHGTEILRDIDLTIERGEIVGVIGESGSGKSMTAFSILQLLPEGSECHGEVILNGMDVVTLSEDDLCTLRGDEVGMVFQEPMTALNPVQTIGAQVAETILIHENTSKTDAMARAREALNRCELPEDQFPMTRYPHELSGGQRQRVVIAMAIALRPKLLIADEPTTALDVTTQAEILALLKRLVTEDKMGLMFITHDLAVVSDLADRITIMKDGEVVEEGPTKTIFCQMQHPYTKALFAASTHQPDREALRVDVPLLSVQNVIRDYTLPRKTLFGSPGKFRAVDDVSFEIRRGESLGLVGESGCGKSTLTRAILGLEPVQSGTIKIDGLNVAESAEARAKMQVVFQDPYGSFNPRFRISKTLSEPFHILKTQPTEDMIDQALVEVGLHPEDKHKYPHEFSGGQRQRIAIARALIIKPDLIVLDEAVSALDVSIRAQILDLLADLSKVHHLTYLFISHDLSVVRSITDRCLVMKAGKIVERGQTEHIFVDPQHRYTQTLINAAPTLDHA